MAEELSGRERVLVEALKEIAKAHTLTPCATRYARVDKDAPPFKCDCPVSVADAALQAVGKGE